MKNMLVKLFQFIFASAVPLKLKLFASMSNYKGIFLAS